MSAFAKVPLSTQVRKATKGENTRRSILDAAERHFAEFGYDAARLEDIADNVGLKRAAIFYHFSGKADLLEQLNSEIHAQLLKLTRIRLVGIVDPWERLMLLVEAWADYMAGRPNAARLILRSCANGEDGSYPSLYSNEVLGILRGIIIEGVEGGRFSPVSAVYLLNLLSSSILHFVCNPIGLHEEECYRPEDPLELAAFKNMLRQTARVVLDVK